MQLHEIETATRKQIITTRNPRCRLETDPVFNLGSKGVGKMVFIGVAIMYGFSKEDIIDYLDITMEELNTKLKKFNDYMAEGVDRQKEEAKAYRADMICHVFRKTSFTVSYIQMNYLGKQRFSYASISF